MYVNRIDRHADKFRNNLPKGLVCTPFDPKTYRDLAPNTVTLIEAKQARGVDFRAAPGCGIDLLITCQLPNDRALVQVMGRVGRYGQECSRWKLAEVETLVSEKLSRRLRLAIIDMCNDIQGLEMKKK